MLITLMSWAFISAILIIIGIALGFWVYAIYGLIRDDIKETFK